MTRTASVCTQNHIYGSMGQAAASLTALLSDFFDLYQEHLIEFEGAMGNISRHQQILDRCHCGTSCWVELGILFIKRCV
jgi:hypothetical protein